VTNPFTLPGTFLKGNLHTHTTQSDGRLSPQEAVDLYRANGYAFLALTDHRTLTRTDHLDTAGIVMLPGMELHQGIGELGQVHHLVAIGMETPIEVPETPSLQAALTYISSRCKFAFIAHPYWTSLTLRDIQGMKGHVGIEVFNTTCQRCIGRGDSGVYWDQLLAQGEKPLGFAVDDCHMHCNDALGGWVQLKCPSLEPESIISALMSGHFYASSGPEITDVVVEADQVTVRCSPCQAVHVICPQPGCGISSMATRGDTGAFTEITLPLSKDWPVYRIECVDERGRKAWTNALWR
jgi:hypothetical protein